VCNNYFRGNSSSSTFFNRRI